MPTFYTDGAPAARRKPLAPNAAYSLINPTRATPDTSTTQPPVQPSVPGGTPPAQTSASTPQGTPQGSSLPYAGVYLESQNNAERAYEQAQTQLLSTRNALYHRYGLTDTGQVDPYSQYGDYQTMLSREGGNLDAAREDAIGRGLGSGGLGRQGERALRYAQGSEQLDFQNQVLGTDSDYRTGLAQALAAKNDAFRQAEEQANQDALQKMMSDGYWTQAGGSPESGSGDGNGAGDTASGGTDTPTNTPSSKAAKDALARYLANPKNTSAIPHDMRPAPKPKPKPKPVVSAIPHDMRPKGRR